VSSDGVQYERFHRIRSRTIRIPEPLDTSRVETPDHLVELTEAVAEQSHNSWVRRRKANGEASPLLIPYRDLPEEERQRNRVQAEELVKSLIVLGCRLVRTIPSAATGADLAGLSAGERTPANRDQEG
jgi:hypothetical protein